MGIRTLSLSLDIRERNWSQGKCNLHIPNLFNVLVSLFHLPLFHHLEDEFFIVLKIKYNCVLFYFLFFFFFFLFLFFGGWGEGLGMCPLGIKLCSHITLSEVFNKDSGDFRKHVCFLYDWLQCLLKKNTKSSNVGMYHAIIILFSRDIIHAGWKYSLHDLFLHTNHS